MRIFLLVDSYLPSPLSNGKLMHDLAVEFSRLGHEAAVVVPAPSLSERLTITREDGVTVVRVKTGTIRHRSWVVRAINEISLSRVIWNAAWQFFEAHPCDLVIYYSPTIFWSGLVGQFKALNRSCGSYLVLRDLFPQWALDTGLLSQWGLPYWYFRSQAFRLYRTADVIGVQSPANLEFFSKPSLRGLYHLEVLFNWTNVEERPGAAAGLRQKLGLQDKVVFLYGGNMGVAQDMDNILRLAANMSAENGVFFLLVGDGSDAERVGREIERRGMTNIMLLPAVPPTEYLAIVAECDVGLITLRRDFKTQNFPGKILSYMQMGKPMVASVNPGSELSAILQGHEAGLVCDNGEDEIFRQCALKLARDPELRLRMGSNAQRLLKEQFDVAAAARQILGHFGQDGRASAGK